MQPGGAGATATATTAETLRAASGDGLFFSPNFVAGTMSQSQSQARAETGSGGSKQQSLLALEAET